MKAECIGEWTRHHQNPEPGGDSIPPALDWRPRPGSHQAVMASVHRSVTMNLAVETVARGRSPSHIWERFSAVVLTKSDQPFLDRVQAVFDDFPTLTEKYQCVSGTEGIRPPKCPQQRRPGSRPRRRRPQTLQPWPRPRTRRRSLRKGMSRAMASGKLGASASRSLR